MTKIVRKNAFNKRPFHILSGGKALDFKVKVDLQQVGKSRNYECDQKKIQKKESEAIHQ